MSHSTKVDAQGVPRCLAPAVTPDNHLVNIDGYLFNLPADPAEGFNYVRALVISSYRAVISGTSTPRERAITFGGASAETVCVRSGPKAEGPVVVQQDPDMIPVRIQPLVPCEGGNGADEGKGPVHGTETIECRKRKFHDACKEFERNKPNQMVPNAGSKMDGFLGDYKDIRTAIRMIQMPPSWVIGSYIEGMITLGGERADTRVLKGEQSCKRCIYTGSICKVLSACDDPLSMARKCSRCYTRPGMFCEFL